jgi:hypothetical protein
MSKRREREQASPSMSPVSFHDGTTDEEPDEDPLPATANQPAEPAAAVQIPLADVPTHTPDSPGPRGPMERVAWTAVVRAQAATEAVFAADPVPPSELASTSTACHSYSPLTRSESHHLALRTEQRANSKRLAYEMDALHGQCNRHQEDLDQSNLETFVILDLPANRVTPDLLQRKKPEPIYT